jgi:protein-disulfide isomerase
MSEEQTTTYAPAPRGSNLGIPVAIVIAAALIAGAIYMSGGGMANKGGVTIPTTDQIGKEQVTAEPPVVAPVTAKDHIQGDPNAPIVIVEYSDFDCPFCKNFHETMNKIMAEYGKTGKVAWVYRQFPLEQLHPNAPKLSAASECVAEQAGNDGFWKFADLVFGEREINAKTDLTRLSEFAQKAGADAGKFELCLNSGKYSQQIQDDLAAGMKAGVQGTPYSILIAGDQQGPINGAQPYAVVKQMLDTVLAQIEGGA